MARQIQQQKTREYWKRRGELYNKAMLGRAERFVAEEIHNQYRRATADLERELSLWYQRFGENNGLTAAQARIALNAKEMDELRWNVDEYIKYGTEHGLTGQWLQQLKNASSKAHITRMDAIMLNLQQQLEIMFGNQLDSLDAHLRSTYNAGFLQTAFEVDKGFGVATSFADINLNKVDKIISRPWVADGLTFSDRIWRDKATLVDELKTQLAQATIRGDDLPTAVKNIADRMEVSRSNAARLVMTESAYFATKAQQDCFNELGVEKVEFVATLDDRTSPECQELDGTVMEAKDAKPGTNAPPMHCWCRSCLAPYFGDKEGRSGSRAARGKDGKTVQVPASMTYNDWARTVGIVPEADKVKPEDGKADADNAQKLQAVRDGTEKIKAAMPQDKYEEYTNIVAKSPMAGLYSNYGNRMNSIKETDTGFFRRSTRQIEFHYVQEKYIANGMDRYSTLAHEMGHYFDALASYDGLTFNEINTLLKDVSPYAFERKASASDQFLAAIRADRLKLKVKMALRGADLKREMRAHDASAGVQDAIDGLLGIRIWWGHGDKYYNRKYNGINKFPGATARLKEAYKKLGIDAPNQKVTKEECRVYEAASEAWANISSAVTTQGAELEWVKNYLPNSYAEFLKIVGKAK